MTAQGVVIVLYVLGLCVSLASHGEKRKKTKYNAKYFITRMIIGLFLLSWGGFFDNM